MRTALPQSPGAFAAVRWPPMLAVMGPRAVVESFWAAMADNDWAGAAAHLKDGCIVDWPCTGERIVGRDDFIAVQEQYLTQTGRWTFDVHCLVADDSAVVSEVTVTDGEQSARVVSFSVVTGGQIVSQVEYWPAAYDPPPGRAGLTRPGPGIP